MPLKNTIKWPPNRRPFPLLAIEWEDSQRPIGAWQWVDEYTLPDVVMCVSVGFLISKTKDAIALAPNLGDLEQERLQASGIIRIPTSAIRRQVEL
jgi:hypothetical protein